jgi:Gluconate 2-dehydrogenase subunit 3
MQRREALRLLASGAILPLISGQAFPLFQAVHDQLPGNAALKTLNPHQNQTVITIAELIIPQTETPGAKAARVNEFIDVILSEWYQPEEKSAFLDGLADVDVRANEFFGKEFMTCTQKQQVEILEGLEDEVPVFRTPRARRALRKPPQQRNFFAMMKQLTLVGYYTSQIGFEQELREQIIPRRHAGCAPSEEAAS